MPSHSGSRSRVEGQHLSAEEVLSLYRHGERNFKGANVDGESFAGTSLRAACFLHASMRGTNFSGADLTYVQFKSADLTGACLAKARITCADVINTCLAGANLQRADLTGSCLAFADCTEADFRHVYFNNMSAAQASFHRAKLDKAHLFSANLQDLDVCAFCDAQELTHGGPSSIDCRTVIRSYRHPDLKRFMLECGVPELFSTYMLDCARALEEPLLRKLMQSTFISYGGPDENFARKLYERLLAHRVVLYFFPVTGKVGERIDNEIFRRIQEHDRILLVCSRNSLERPGVIYEIQETLDREASAGGATYLLPITLDDYVFSGWKKTHPDLAERLGRRIIGDFRKARRSGSAFEKALERVIDALKINSPSS